MARLLALLHLCAALQRPAPRRPRTTRLMARGVNGMGRTDDATRRQARVSQLVRSELAQVIRNGHFEVKTRQRVDPAALKATSILDVSVSPDLRAATATITTRGDVAAKREAFSWLTMNRKSVRYALAKRMSHSKRVPDVTFRKADVAAATTLMKLVDDVAASEEGGPASVDGLDLDEAGDDLDWGVPAEGDDEEDWLMG